MGEKRSRGHGSRRRKEEVRMRGQLTACRRKKKELCGRGGGGGGRIKGHMKEEEDE